MFIGWCANYIYTSFERPAVRPTVDRSTGFNFVFQTSHCLFLSGYSMLTLHSQCHIHISIHSQSFGQQFSSLMAYLTVFYNLSDKEVRNLKTNTHI